MEQVQEKTKVEPQPQEKPGLESEMNPAPIYDNENIKGSGKLLNKIALITGGDSGIGRAVAVLFAKEGADVVVSYFNEHEDAEQTKQDVEKYGRKCLLKPGDLTHEGYCYTLIDQVIRECGRIDILVNNAATQTVAESLDQISTEQLMNTFTTNFFSFFWLTKAALQHMQKGGVIINTASVTAYKGKKNLIDYASTKGAIVAFTRSLAINLADKGIRVNAVAPGPIWTPLIPASFNEEQISQHGTSVPLGRPGHPVEVAPSYLFLACDDSTYINGQVLHPNGGEILNT